MDTIQSHNAELIKLINSLAFPIKPIKPKVKEIVKRDRSIRAVVFDVYGTLFVSGSGDIGIAKQMSNTMAAATALEAAGIIENNLAERTKEGIGNYTLETLHSEIERAHREKRSRGIAYPEVNIVEIWEQVIESLEHSNLTGIKREKIKEYSNLASERGDTRKRKLLEHIAVQYEFRVNHVWPMPDMMETLNGIINGTKPMKLGIISNAQFFTPLMIEAFTQSTIEDLGFDNKLLIWSYKEEVAKPSSMLFMKIRERLVKIYGILPEETLYIGNDMLNDISPAKRAGFKTCLFAGDTRSLRLREEIKECREIKPDFVITRLKTLLDIIL